MHYGVTIFPTAYSMPMAELGPALEERGFESVWVAEHSHIPASRASPWPGGPELPQIYYDTLDPFVALAAAAATTTTLKLGTGIALVIQRDPIHTAKEVASLDVVSNGRFCLGVGAGWNAEEMADHGADFGRRFGRMRESVEAMKAIWTNEVAEYHGDQIDFGPMYQNPKPVQSPHPPVHVGGGYPGALRRAIAWADGWIPIGGRGPDDAVDWLAEADRACADAGRDRAGFEVSLYAAPPKREMLDTLAEAGLDRAVFVLPSEGTADLLPRLDRLAELIV
jgi:probable F420-dependent oxidoreductase